jgi:hypothetical protein
MTPIPRSRQDSEAGVILIILAIAMVVLIGMLAIAIDTSFGFVQNRRAQNAADFGAFAAAQELNDSYYCNGVGTPSLTQIEAVIQKIVDDNDAGLGTAWSAQFLTADKTKIGPAFSPGTTGNVPNGACGVNVTASPSWAPFFAGVLGFRQLKGFATASVGPVSTSANNIAIVALNKVGPHEILGGGAGQFIVSGNIVANSNVTEQPWSQLSAGDEWDDAIDAKTGSTLSVYGTIYSSNADGTGSYQGDPLWPLDTCFESAGDQVTNHPTPYTLGGPPPWYQLLCGSNGAGVNYDDIANTEPQQDDPLQGANAPANPWNTTITCPGEGTQTYTQVPQPDAQGVTTLLPGIYPNAVQLTGDVVFDDCSGYPGEPAYPGVYNFVNGLSLDPGAGDTVKGSNIVIATQNPYPMAGNVPGSVTGGVFTPTPGTSGNGAPCLPSGTMTSVEDGGGTSAEYETPQPPTAADLCGGTDPPEYGVTARYDNATTTVDASMTGTGDNYSLIIGGAGTVNLTGPTSGAYGGTAGPGVVFYQDPNTQANYGFDAEAGDTATINLTGVVYNASLTSYGASAPQDFWDGVSGGVPFYAGGTLQAGYGTGWSGGPTESGGSVTLTGTAIVDDFNTDGSTTSITIIGEPYTLPGASNLSLIG